MLDNPNRAIAGVAATFGRRINGVTLTAPMFREWLALGVGLDLRLDHGSLINHTGVLTRIGAARRFSATDQDLLVLAELDKDRAGFNDSVLYDLRLQLAQRWLAPGWGFSLASHVGSGVALPFELSITRSPADLDAVILGVGAEAVAKYEELAGVPAAAVIR
jgi:hypothetical protein